jgi:iron-sulfur cluster repair protein YtfE (RIC family)
MSSIPNCTIGPVDSALTVNAVLARWPDTIPLLNALGIDTCCGGGESLRDAARRAGVPLPVLLAAVEHGACGGAR